MDTSTVLIVDDNDHQHELFRCYAMMTSGIFLEHALTIEQALAKIAESIPDIIFLDSRLTPYDDFRQTVPIIRDAGYQGRIVVISADIDDSIFHGISNHSVHSCVDKSALSMSSFGHVMSMATA